MKATPHESAYHLYVPDGTDLWVLNGVVWDGRLIASRVDNDSPAGTHHGWRHYDGLSLSLTQGSELTSMSIAWSYVAPPFHNRATDVPSSPITEALRLTLHAEDVARVYISPVSSEASDSRCVWIEALVPCEGTPSQDSLLGLREVISLRVVVPTTAVRDAVLEIVGQGVEESRSRKAMAIVSNKSSTSELVAETLSDLRLVQQRVHTALATIRQSDFLLSESTSDATPSSMPDTTQHTRVDQRHRLQDATVALRDIQARRQSRSALLAKFEEEGHADEISAPSGGWQIGTARSQRAATQSNLAPPFRAVDDAVMGAPRLRNGGELRLPSSRMTRKLSEVPRTHRSVHSNVKLLCKHCGEVLMSREEQRRHEPQCAFRQVRCRKCGDVLRAIDFRRHRDVKCTRRRSNNVRSLGRNGSGFLSEASSSSMEEQSSSVVSADEGSDGSLSGRRGGSGSNQPRRGPLSEIQRAGASQWVDVVASPSMRSSSRGSLTFSPADSAASLNRRRSIVESVEQRCPHCGRRSDASHIARCAYRPVRCGVCGMEVLARQALEHAAHHNRR